MGNDAPEGNQMTFEELMDEVFPAESHIDKGNVSISCDGTPAGKRDRPVGKWTGTVRCNIAGRSVRDVVNAAAAEYVIRWASTARNDIPAFRSDDVCEFIVPAPGSRTGRIVHREPTSEEIEDHVVQHMSVEEIEALLTAKRDAA